MEAAQLLAMLRRRAWSIVRFTVVVGLAAGILSYLRTPQYEASAQVLLRPNDASESLTQTNTQPVTGLDSSRYANSQANIVQSPAVAAIAVRNVPGALTADELLNNLGVRVDPNSNVLTIIGVSTDPAQAQAIADETARAYINNRRDYARANLQQAVDDVSKQLITLQHQIESYDAQIKAGGSTGSGSSSITGPSNPSSSSAPKAPTTTTNPADPGLAPITNDEVLNNARYSAQLQYQDLFAKQNQLKIDISLKRGEAELVSEAKLPASPTSPKPVRDGVLGAVLGLLIGAGVAFGREQLDDSVKTAEELEELTGAPVLAEVPVDAELAAHPEVLVASERPLSAFAEAVRGLRTSLQFMGVDEPVRSVLVTSAVPGDGKTAVAANLAVAYAQAGLRTVLVSADLRRPRVDEMFPEIRLGNGLSGMLTQLAAVQRRNRTSGEAEPTVTVDLSANGAGRGDEPQPPVRDELDAVLAEHLVCTSIENLYVLPAGLRVPNPAEVLGSKLMREVMKRLAERADMVVVDSSPTLAVTDAVVLSTQVDGVVLVVPSDQISRRDVQRVAKTFESVDVRLLGTVLNRSSELTKQYYTYGYQPEAPKPAHNRRRRRSSGGVLEGADISEKATR